MSRVHVLLLLLCSGVYHSVVTDIQVNIWVPGPPSACLVRWYCALFMGSGFDGFEKGAGFVDGCI